MDVIFAGGGTAGTYTEATSYILCFILNVVLACVAAGRLSKANPHLKILLIEGGKNNFQDPTVVNPAVYLTHLAPDSKTALVSHADTPNLVLAD